MRKIMSAIATGAFVVSLSAGAAFAQDTSKSDNTGPEAGQPVAYASKADCMEHANAETDQTKKKEIMEKCETM
ncbi:hypothetical protein [Rhizobium halophytocola]|uniref:Membrane protein n=1 Tax=Rhizobium halophytocola TaxID=735519 RepID=A0ABS4DWR8_9HYPH|nr:hypothetical protein [Rhizobium halophytocola]MBP1850143.1 putative membrane protein [Rhizobium halophytocola]